MSRTTSATTAPTGPGNPLPEADAQGDPGRVKTKVLMLSVTPVNNRFTDLRNQLAWPTKATRKPHQSCARTEALGIFRGAQAGLQCLVRLPGRTPLRSIDSLDFDFCRAARQRHHHAAFTRPRRKDIGRISGRRKPLSRFCPLTERSDVLGFSGIFELSQKTGRVMRPSATSLPSRLKKYRRITQTGGQQRTLHKPTTEELPGLMTIDSQTAESSRCSRSRLTLQSLRANNETTLSKDRRVQSIRRLGHGGRPHGSAGRLVQRTMSCPCPTTRRRIGSKIKISLADMDLPSWGTN